MQPGEIIYPHFPPLTIFRSKTDSFTAAPLKHLFAPDPNLLVQAFKWTSSTPYCLYYIYLYCTSFPWHKEEVHIFQVPLENTKLIKVTARFCVVWLTLMSFLEEVTN